MRALFLVPSAYLWGGVQTWLDQTVDALGGRGWGVRVGLVQGPRFHDAVAYAREHPGLNALHVPCMTGTPEGRARAVQDALERERPDVLVVVNVGDGVEGGRRWKARVGGKRFRIVDTIHAFDAPQFAEIRAFGPVIDRVVTTNRLTQKAVRETCGLDPARVGYAPYGAERPAASGVPGTAPGGPFRLAWVGRIEEPQKRVSDLVSTLIACADLGVQFRCDVAGDGDGFGSLSERLGPLVDAGLVRLLGRVSRERLYTDVYPGLNVLLLTSSWETGPIVAWEAMRHGATLVSTRYVGLDEEAALQHGENCLLSPVGDVHGLARSIASLAGCSELTGRLGSAARAVADRRYSVEASGEAWADELREAGQMPATSAVQVRVRRPGGRLDRMLGPKAAETIRRVADRRCRPSEPSDEWPHAAAAFETDPDFESAFRRVLRPAGLGLPRGTP